tara:strand:+ start:206 stop:529 length:324 start_codon:yes stop_codon:yes gene_type:complete
MLSKTDALQIVQQTILDLTRGVEQCQISDSHDITVHYEDLVKAAVLLKLVLENEEAPEVSPKPSRGIGEVVDILEEHVRHGLEDSEIQYCIDRLKDIEPSASQEVQA